MMQPNAYRHLNLIKDENGDHFIQILTSYGSCALFDSAFDKGYSRLRIYGPTEDSHQIINHVICRGNSEQDIHILLSTSSRLMPWGTGFITGCDDAIICRFPIEDEIEVFIYKDQGGFSHQIFIAIIEGDYNLLQGIDGYLLDQRSSLEKAA